MNDSHAAVLQRKSFAKLHPHTTKFVVIKLLLARKVEMH